MATIRNYFDSQMADLRSRLFLLSGRVREEFTLGFDAFIQRDAKLIEAVYALAQEVQSLQAEVEAACFTLISRQQPVAQDLLLIITVYNINLDLERMGSQARGIARSTERLLTMPAFEVPHEFHTMYRMAQDMHDHTFMGWESKDVDLLWQIVARDEQVDELNQQVQRALFSRMAQTEQASDIAALYEFTRVSREVERFADLTCNIARAVCTFVQDTEYGCRQSSGGTA